MTDIISGTKVGHLPTGNSCVTRLYTVLTFKNYWVSLLVQGGLEMPHRNDIHMLPTMKNKELIRIYYSHVDILYYQRQEANIVASFESEDDPGNVKRVGDVVYFKK